MDSESRVVQQSHSGMKSLGTQWINKGSENKEFRAKFNDIALSAAYLSHAHDQEWGEITRADATLGKNVVSTGDYELQRRLLTAIALEMTQE
ncbi:hypothetical protein [Acidovorax sp.]|uniref:hypothetical protein n=1 Tax=Acidovorax sp. TaxID=1872122 RepID=UPI00391F9196